MVAAVGKFYAFSPNHPNSVSRIFYPDSGKYSYARLLLPCTNMKKESAENY